MSILHSLVDSRGLFMATVSTDVINTWISQNTKRSIFNIITSIPTPTDYIKTVGAASIQVINPPTPTPVAGCWKWCNNSWKLNDDLETFPTDLVTSLRQKAYKKETDGLKLDADYNSIISGNPPDYALWIGGKQAIMERYPKLPTT